MPKPPTKPKMVKNGSHQFKISSSISTIDKYCTSLSPTLIIFECNGKRVEEKIESEEEEHFVVIKNLNSNTDYECSAFLRNFEGISEVSEAAIFKTLEERKRILMFLK